MGEGRSSLSTMLTSTCQILLERGKVIAVAKRVSQNQSGREEAARKIGGSTDLSESLLEEVASLRYGMAGGIDGEIQENSSPCLLTRWCAPPGATRSISRFMTRGQAAAGHIFVANIESKDRPDYLR